MNKYGVLIVDDSAVMRKKLSQIVEDTAQLTVIGKARNGVDALEKIAYLQPDLVLLDAEMPIMDGFNTLKKQMQIAPLPIIVLGEANDEERALRLGAIQFYEKNVFFDHHTVNLIDFVQQSEPIVNEAIAKRKKTISTQTQLSDRILVIGSSTGGPAALQTILKQFPKEIHVPVLIIQHMPVGFTKSLANRFNDLCPFVVKEAEHDELLESGTVYIAPAGNQTLLAENKKGQYRIQLTSSISYPTLYKPSVDVTLLSLAPKSKANILALILTGMGDDGLKGCEAVKAYGGTVFTEAEESCVVYGMPKVVVNAGLADKQLRLENIAQAISPYIS